jgi:hypothetical protein
MSKLPNSNNDNGVRSPEDRPPNTPRWVKVSGIIVIILFLLLVILKLTGIGGNHGPGRHIHGGDPTEQIKQEAPRKHTPPGGNN